MPKLKRNHLVVSKAKALNGKRTLFTIEGVKGLGLQVSPSGSRHWVFRYEFGDRRAGGKQRFMSIGDASMIPLGKAVERAEELFAQVKVEGRDPAKERVAEAGNVTTVSELIQEFLDKHVQRKLRPTTAAQYEYRLKAFVEPEIGHLAAEAVRKRDIIELADSVAEDGKTEKKSSGRGGKGGDREGGAPRLADGVVEIISSMYGWAQKRDMLEHNPAFRIAKYSERPRRDRVLSNEEFPKFWAGVKTPEVGDKLAMILQLLLLTGQRRGEVAGSLVSEFDLDCEQPTWTIDASRTKNGLKHTLPLSPWAASLWRDARSKFADDVYMFPASRAGVSQHVHFGAVTKAMRWVRESVDLPELIVHDLRRTVRTRMAELGIPREISARLLNHVDEYERGVHDESYNRYEYFREKHEAMGRWEDLLKTLLQNATVADMIH